MLSSFCVSFYCSEKEKVSVEVRVTNANPSGDRRADLYVNGEYIYRICVVQKSDPYFPPSAFGPEDFPRE